MTKVAELYQQGILDRVDLDDLVKKGSIKKTELDQILKAKKQAKQKAAFGVQEVQEVQKNKRMGSGTELFFTLLSCAIVGTVIWIIFGTFGTIDLAFMSVGVIIGLLFRIARNTDA